MDSIEVSQDSQERSDLENVLLIGGTAMLFAGLFSWLRKKRPFSGEVPDGLTDPPPIIIKSGSFDIETDQPLIHNGPSSDGGLHKYKRVAFGKILGVRVFVVNEALGTAYASPFPSRAGIQVEVSLQKYNENTGRWDDVTEKVIIKTVPSGTSDDFELHLRERKLHKRGKPKPKRLERWCDTKDDNDPSRIRINDVTIIRQGESDAYIYQAESDYTITFYNKLKP